MSEQSIASSSENPWGLSEATRRVPASGIVKVFNYGRTKPGLIPLWVGEGDQPTPAFICEAASRSLFNGETFYTYQGGIPPLREAISAYMSGLYGQNLEPERFFVTIGGMHALQIALRLVTGPGDEVIVPTPAWPNFDGAITANGATTRMVEMHLGPVRYELDFDAIAAAITPRTKAICINSPANPTGWTATRDDQERILTLARKHGLWIIADEIYGRFFYEGAGFSEKARAPSFHDIMDANDRVMFVQTMSKNWAMTGWRLGWLEAPPELTAAVASLIQYSTSGVPMALQRGAVAALEGGESLIQEQVTRARQNRDVLMAALSRQNGLTIPSPSGAFYLFLKVDGLSDSLESALRLVDVANVGVSPGVAFGKGGEGFLRICYLRKPEDIAEATKRLVAGLQMLRSAPRE